MKYNEYPQFPDKRENGESVIEQTHLILFRILQIFDAICKKHNIEYWLDYGTLLGAVRHKGFVPWDTDIDIGILRPDYDIFVEKGASELPVDVFFQDINTDPILSSQFFTVEGHLRDRYSSTYYYADESIVKWHSGIQIDLFVYDHYPKECITNPYERHYRNSRVYLTFEEIKYLSTMLFEGSEFPIPYGYHTYLERCYGDYMQLPPKNQQRILKTEPFIPCNHFASLKWRNKTCNNNNSNEYPQFPDKRESGNNVINQVHSVLFRMLQIFDTICKKHDINYCLDYGTLLGAVRHKGFIPWDEDIDLGILRVDYEVFLKKGVPELPIDIYFQNSDTDPCITKYSWLVEGRLRDRYSTTHKDLSIFKDAVNWHNGIPLDFFIYDKYPENSYILNSFERNLRNSRVYLKYEEIEYLDTMMFGGAEFPIPVGYDEYLKRAYGNYMELPPEDERKIPFMEVFTPCKHFASLEWKNRIL